ncbi:TldD protein [Natronospira proteinivora]|uniref:TldD protein n=1 Tax=Natronospira proteinivora TaxID=1807133 RepID=A0ABT1GBM7_9GAMM|nr:metalloprotease TldD [Natronospira proteinivora]MCP1727688.1 TldD protein [Natronospira proteinivora]
MSDALNIAKAQLLEPGGLDESALSRVLSRMMSPSVDEADLYFQLRRKEGWSLEDGIVKDGGHSLDRGVGLRAVSGEKTGFAYSDDIVLPALERASGMARAIASGGQSGSLQAWRAGGGQSLYQPLDPIESLAPAQKVALLQKVDAACRDQDSRIKKVNVSLNAQHEVVLIAGNDGRLVPDVRPLIRMSVVCIAEQDGRREQGMSGAGGRISMQAFMEGEEPMRLAREAARSALVNLEAVEAPAGTMPVVLGPGWPGVLLHEAIGHGLEGDFNRKGTSAFSGRIGERVASEYCTVVDDGTLSGRRGSLNVDDEGEQSNCTTLIENGILKGYMQDRMNARLMGQQSTGNGRRESYAHLPMPRMTNTYMQAGPHDPEEIIQSVDKGLYAVNFGGGQVDITSGKFVFSASEAYLIENGRITRPVKGATLVGNGPDVLTRVSMVGNDLELDRGIGVCGKDGQSVPVGVGQPTLRVDSLTVGGTG